MRNSTAGAVGTAILALVLAAGAPALAQQGAPANGEWPTYGGDLGGTKYSPLDQIDRSNFGDLEIAWRWLSADAFLSIDTPDGGEWWADSRLIFEELLRRDPDRWRDAQPPYITNLKATPLMVGGRLFINMPTSQAASIDAETGETLWVYNPKTYEEGTTTMTARWNQRGVAYWSDGPARAGRADPVRDRQRLSHLRRRQDRPALRRLRRRRLGRPDPRASRGPSAGSRDWLNALLYFGAVAAARSSATPSSRRRPSRPTTSRGRRPRAGCAASTCAPGA